MNIPATTPIPRPRTGRIFGFVLAGILISGLLPSTGLSQELRLSALRQWPDHDLLGSPSGIGVSGSMPLGESMGIRVGWESNGDHFRSIGSTCVGLIPPDQMQSCADEPRKEDSQANALTLSIPFRFLRKGPFEAYFVPAFRKTWLESEQTGSVSGRTRSASKTMSGFEVGVETVYHPRWSRVFRVFGALHSGLLNQYRDGVLIDGYSPFESDVGFLRIEFGVSLSRPESRSTSIS